MTFAAFQTSYRNTISICDAHDILIAMKDELFASPSEIETLRAHAASIAKVRADVMGRAGVVPDPLFPDDLAWARDVLHRLPPSWSRTNNVTGLNIVAPYEALHALKILEASSDEGAGVGADDEALIHRALKHYGTQLSQRTFHTLPVLLGVRSIPYLEPLLAMRWCSDWVRDELTKLGVIPPALAADADLDVDALRRAWHAASPSLPAWSEPPLTIRGPMPRECGLPFVVAAQTRVFVDAFHVQLFPNEGACENPEAKLLSVATTDARKRLVLIGDPEGDGLPLVASKERLKHAIRSALPIECRLVFPHLKRVLTRGGSVPVHIDGVRPHSLAFRVGGLAARSWDRPFLVALWDVLREEAIGVGLVTGPLVMEATLGRLANSPGDPCSTDLA